MSADIPLPTVTLDEIRLQVMRRLLVSVTIRFDRLNLALQAAKGWASSHLYEIRVRDVGWEFAGSGLWAPLKARKARLVNVLEGMGAKTLHYLFDFGDDGTTPSASSWSRRRSAARPKTNVDHQGNAAFLEAIADTGHEEHAEMLQWIGDNSDPATVDIRPLGNRSRMGTRHKAAKCALPMTAADIGEISEEWVAKKQGRGEN